MTEDSPSPQAVGKQSLLHTVKLPVFRLTSTAAESEAAELPLEEEEPGRPKSDDVEVLATRQKRPADVNDEYLCQYCSCHHKRQDDLNAHEELCPKGEYRYCRVKNVWECPICSKCFKRDSQMEDHIRSHLYEDPFGCNKCGQMFRQMYKRNVHELSCEGQNVAPSGKKRRTM